MIAIPASLTLLRLFLGPLALWLAFADAPRSVYAVILVAGLLSDYFDGVLARRLGVVREWLRRLGVVREWLRRLDSTVDVIFYIFLLLTAWRVAPEPLAAGVWAIVLMLGSEAACILVSLLKFHRLPATHAYTAKLYGLVLFISFLGVLCFSWGVAALWVTCAFALLANAEIMAILLLSHAPPVDIPTVLRILKTRQPSARH